MLESTPAFVDGFGRRVVRRASAAVTPTEHLLLDPALARHADFVAALQARVAKAQNLRLSQYAKVLRVEDDGAGGVSLVSDYVKGWRLADMLDVAESENLTLDIGVVMLLLRQLLPTAALLTTQSRDVASGALGPEHLLLTPQGRVVPTEYVLGPAIEALAWTPEHLWRTLRVATPPTGGGGKAVSHRGDVAQLGITVLSLVLGRRLRDDEFPERLEGLVQAARQRTPTVIDAPLSNGLRAWLLRALQLQAKSFATLFDAQMALERLLATESSLIAQPAELDIAMSRLDRFMPEFEAPDAPPELVALPEVAASADDWAPPPPPPDWAVPAALPRADRSGASATAVMAPPLVALAAELMAPPPMASATSMPAAAAAVVVEPAKVEAPVQTLVSAPAPDVTPQPEPEPVPVKTEPVRAIRPEPVAAVSAPEPEPRIPPAPEAAPFWRSPMAVAALAALVLVQAVVLGVQWMRPSAGLGGDGELVVSSRPDGAKVTVDDQDRGVTPLTIALKPGTHVMQLRMGTAEPRVIPLTIRPGVQTAQYVELQGVASTGVLEVRSEPSTARVSIDGKARGSTPLTLRDVPPGDYQVVLERGGWKSTQTVRIEAGMTAQLVVPIR